VVSWAPLNADELRFAQVSSAPVFTGTHVFLALHDYHKLSKIEWKVGMHVTLSKASFIIGGAIQKSSSLYSVSI
jgi:hypothetical protein